MQIGLSKLLALLLFVIIAPVCFVFFFRFLRRHWPVPQKCKELMPISSELESKYRKWDLLGGLFVIFLGFAGGYVTWELCRALCSWRAGFFVGEHLLFPRHEICLLPAVPGAIFVGGAGTLILYRIFLKSQFAEFACYGSLKLGINVIRLLRSMLFVLFILCFIATILTINNYMILSYENIQSSSLMSLNKRTYQYSDIKSIDFVTDIKNQFKTDMSIKILFNDGYIWNSDNTEELSNDRAKIIADYLTEKTNLQINHSTINRSEKRR